MDPEVAEKPINTAENAIELGQILDRHKEAPLTVEVPEAIDRLNADGTSERWSRVFLSDLGTAILEKTNESGEKVMDVKSDRALIIENAVLEKAAKLEKYWGMLFATVAEGYEADVEARITKNKGQLLKEASANVLAQEVKENRDIEDGEAADELEKQMKALREAGVEAPKERDYRVLIDTLESFADEASGKKNESAADKLLKTRSQAVAMVMMIKDRFGNLSSVEKTLKRTANALREGVSLPSEVYRPANARALSQEQDTFNREASEIMNLAKNEDAPEDELVARMQNLMQRQNAVTYARAAQEIQNSPDAPENVRTFFVVGEENTEATPVDNGVDEVEGGDLTNASEDTENEVDPDAVTEKMEAPTSEEKPEAAVLAEDAPENLPVEPEAAPEKTVARDAAEIRARIDEAYASNMEKTEILPDVENTEASIETKQEKRRKAPRKPKAKKMPAPEPEEDYNESPSGNDAYDDVTPPVRKPNAIERLGSWFTSWIS